MDAMRFSKELAEQLLNAFRDDAIIESPDDGWTTDSLLQAAAAAVVTALPPGPTLSDPNYQTQPL